jgi:quercetin dioxygenase-like cupin family protein
LYDAGPSSSLKEAIMAGSGGPLDLFEMAKELLDEARHSHAGRAARTLTPGAGVPLKQTLLALAAGASLQEHMAPSPATIQILIGVAHLTSAGERTLLSVGEWASIPEATHGLEAAEDLAALLTVATA